MYLSHAAEAQVLEPRHVLVLSMVSFKRYVLLWRVVRCVTFFSPLPVRFPGLQTTSMDAMLADVLFTLSVFSARKEAMLKSSEPQNKMLKGSHAFVRAEGV